MGNVAYFRSLAQRPQSLGRGKVPEQEPVSGKGETIERARGKKMVAKTVGLRRKQQAEGCPAFGPRGRETVVSSPLGLEKQGLGCEWAEVLAVPYPCTPHSCPSPDHHSDFTWLYS